MAEIKDIYKYNYYQISDFCIENTDKNHIWRKLTPRELYYEYVLIDLDDTNKNLSFCICEICKNHSLRINKDEYFPETYKYFTTNKLLTCNEYIIKHIIE